MVYDTRTVGTEKEQFRLSVKIDEMLLDPRALARDKEVQDGVDVFFKAEPRRRSKTGEDCALCASFGDVLVFQRLS